MTRRSDKRCAALHAARLLAVGVVVLTVGCGEGDDGWSKLRAEYNEPRAARSVSTDVLAGVRLVLHGGTLTASLVPPRPSRLYPFVRPAREARGRKVKARCVATPIRESRGVSRTRYEATAQRLWPRDASQVSFGLSARLPLVNTACALEQLDGRHVACVVLSRTPRGCYPKDRGARRAMFVDRGIPYEKWSDYPPRTIVTRSGWVGRTKGQNLPCRLRGCGKRR